MKYYSLSHSTENLGDDIQSIASSHFLPRVDGYIDREFPWHARNRAKGFIIANAWHAHFDDSLVMPDNIIPFYIAVHISRPRLLTSRVVNHLKKHSPIGCRDLTTLALLRTQGIPCFFSGCLTTTLTSTALSRTGPHLICDLDPRFLHVLPPRLVEQARFTSAECSASQVGLRFPFSRPSYVAWYRRMTPRRYRLLRDAAHAVASLSDPASDEKRILERLEAAKNLLISYASSSAVITGRLHCALPCAAFGTPFRFLHPNPSDARFAGLGDLLGIRQDASLGRSVTLEGHKPNVTAISETLAKICRLAVAMHMNPFKDPEHLPLLEELRAAYETVTTTPVGEIS